MAILWKEKKGSKPDPQQWIIQPENEQLVTKTMKLYKRSVTVIEEQTDGQQQLCQLSSLLNN